MRTGSGEAGWSVTTRAAGPPGWSVTRSPLRRGYASTAMVREGDLAPDFTLRSDGGEPVTLSDFRGKPVVLYFYPKDDTAPMENAPSTRPGRRRPRARAAVPSRAAAAGRAIAPTPTVGA